MSTLAATGHRPDKLGGYHREAQIRLRRFARVYLVTVDAAAVVTGMALGWDMAIAEACVDLGLPFTAAIPFAGQERKWPAESQERYHAALARASRVVTVCSGGYAPEKMQHRNEWMVGACDYVFALWNGSPGGTANCVRFAQRQRKLVVNLWPLWEKFQ